MRLPSKWWKCSSVFSTVEVTRRHYDFINLRSSKWRVQPADGQLAGSPSICTQISMFDSSYTTPAPRGHSFNLKNTIGSTRKNEHVMKVKSNWLLLTMLPTCTLLQLGDIVQMTSFIVHQRSDRESFIFSTTKSAFPLGEFGASKSHACISHHWFTMFPVKIWAKRQVWEGATQFWQDLVSLLIEQDCESTNLIFPFWSALHMQQISTTKATALGERTMKKQQRRNACV